MAIETYGDLVSGLYLSTIDWKNRDPKKDFTFVWSLELPTSKFKSGHLNEDFIKDRNDAFGFDDETKANRVGIYVSQLAQKVDLPSSEINELSDYHFGELDTTIPYGMKYNNIQVSYLDDEFDTVYTLHYNWLSWISKHNYPKYLMCGRGSYLNFGVSNEHKYKNTSKSVYENIHPISVSRTSADKGGSGLGGVTVVYAQIIAPKLADVKIENF